MLYRLLALILVPLTRALVRLRVAGMEHLPAEGPVLLVPNHVSWVDPVVVAVAAWRRRRRLQFLVTEGAFRYPVIGAVLRRTGQIRVRPKGKGPDAVHAAQRVLGAGGAVVIYPEGTIPRAGARVRARPGAGALASGAGIAVIPVATWGMERGRPWWPRRRVGVVLGPPLDVPGGTPAERATFMLDAAHALVPHARRLACGEA
jgi:1-acyl-sn-glycerol-3-phosphate acyltransferase